MRRNLMAGSALAFALLGASCGYHTGGHADLVPKHIKTIAVASFSNATARYKITERLPAAIAREFITRTRYNVVADPNAADAVLTGSVMSYGAYPVTLDPATSRASTVQVYVHLQVMLRDKSTGAVLYSRPDLETRERYEISTDQRAYLEETDVALDRISRDVARTVVSAVLENF